MKFYFWALLNCTLLIFTWGCSGRNIHKELKADPEVLVRQWTLPTHGPFDAADHGFEFSNPILFENTLIFGNHSFGLASIYTGLMQYRWKLAIQGGVTSPPTLDRSTLYVAGGDGFFYSINAETGKVNWKYEIRNTTASRPTVSQGRVFVTTTDDVVYALDAGTGKWLWHYRRRSASGATIMGASQPLVDRNEVLVGLTDGFLVSLSVSDGQLKWERKLHTGAKFTDVDAHPVLEEGIIYIPSYDGALYALKREKGDIVWRFDAGGSKQITIEGDRIYFPSNDGTIYCLDKQTAKVIWKFELDKGTPTQLAITDRHVIFGSSFQYFYALDKETGKGLYRYNTGYDSGFYGSPLYHAELGRVYILSGAGNLMAFSVRTAARKRRPFGAIDGYIFTENSERSAKLFR